MKFPVKENCITKTVQHGYPDGLDFYNILIILPFAERTLLQISHESI